MVCRVSDDEIRSHPHSHTDTDKAHGDCGLGGYGVWGDGSEGAIHNLGKARQQAGKSSVSVSVMDVQAIMDASAPAISQARQRSRRGRRRDGWTLGWTGLEAGGRGRWGHAFDGLFLVGSSKVPPVYRLSHTNERARQLAVNYSDICFWIES